MAQSQSQKTYDLVEALGKKQSDFQLKISSEISDIKNGVAKIESYLYSDKDTNKKGIVEKVEDLDIDIKEIKNYKKLVYGLVIFFTGLGGVVGWISKIFFSK